MHSYPGVPSPGHLSVWGSDESRSGVPAGELHHVPVYLHVKVGGANGGATRT